MATRYQIHPSIGIAREGNSRDAFYLAPETIGGLPLDCDPDGNPVLVNGRPKPVERFKDATGAIKRQAARFKAFAYDDTNPNDPGREITINDPDVAGIEWTVHLANKKAIWYSFSELQGNLMLGPQNSYANQQVPPRNAAVVGEAARQKLIIDPGPRSVCEPKQRVPVSRDTIPSDYPHGSFPDPNLKPFPIDTLGDVMMDSEGRLLVLGGFGNACGSTAIDTFAGADTWHDDISDGPVTCRLRLKSGDTVELRAWVVVGSPKVAPELLNIVTLDDLLYDTGVRYLKLDPTLYDESSRPGGWNPEYVSHYERDIAPIITRPGTYRWVANVPSMIAFSPPPFDTTDAGESNRARREAFFRYFRRPDGFGQPNQEQVLLSDHGLPLMPLNSGSNSVSNADIDKFLTLTPTQYFLLQQWAAGKFVTPAEPAPLTGVHPLDRASTGNCVGGPLCPGIEVTWSLGNPPLYEAPYRIQHRYDEAHYAQFGLSTSHDECTGGGCEPGDLTKRMAIPWQADFFDCSTQYINFTDPNVNKDANRIPVPPTYFSYWWPPQSPMFVMNGAMTAEEQHAAGVPAGLQVYYPRGVNSFAEMITAWKYLGFILNVNSAADRDDYPYFVEKERNHDKFVVAAVAVGRPSSVVTAEDTNFVPAWFLSDQADRDQRRSHARRVARTR